MLLFCFLNKFRRIPVYSISCCKYGCVHRISVFLKGADNDHIVDTSFSHILWLSIFAAFYKK